MLTLFYIIIFIELLTVFYNLFKFLLYKLFSSSNKQHNNVKNLNNDFHKNVLIPCYNEISIISNTLNYFEKITKNFNNIDIYVITTDKEKSENPRNTQTTYEYLLSLEIFNNSNFHILNFPHSSGMMADQLNFAITEILKVQNLPNNKIYFSIYNADSNPDNGTFDELTKKIKNNNFPKIIQQYSNYFSNYSSQSFIMKGFAIYQTAFEFRNRFNKQLYF